MSGVQSKAARLQKEQKEREPGATERRMAASVDLKYSDLSAVVMKEFNAFVEKQDTMFIEMRESLNGLKEMMIKRASPDVKGSGDGTEHQERKDRASGCLKPGEKAEEESSGTEEDTENLTARSKGGSKLNRKQDKAKPLNSDHAVRPSLGRVGERPHGAGDGRTESGGPGEVVEGENTKPSKEAGHRNNESLPCAPREDSAPEGGAILRLAADFSSATLDVSQQWGQVFRLLKAKELEPELRCTVTLAFKCGGETRAFSDLHSLRQFTNGKLFLKELLKDVLPGNERGRRNGLQGRLGKTLADTKHEAGRAAGDSLSFLFIKEVKVDSLEVKTYQKEAEQKDEETLKKQGTSRTVEEEDTPETEEGETSEEEASEMEEEEEDSGEEEEEEQTSGGEEEGEENSEVGEEEEASSIPHETQGSIFHGLTVVEKHGVETVPKSGEDIGLISLVVDSESEEEVNGNTSSQSKKKETFHELKDLAFSYLVWDSKEKKLMKCQEGGAGVLSDGHRAGTTPCLTLYLASPSESQQAGSDGAKSHSHTNLSVPSQVAPLLPNIEKERYNKTSQMEELMADLLHETKENFRRGVISIIRQMQREVENIKKLYFFDVLNMKNLVDDLSSLARVIEARVSKQEDIVEELTNETLRLAKEVDVNEKLREREDRLRSSNIRVIGIPEKENRENGAEDIIKEIIKDNFAELEDQHLEIVSAHRIPNSVDEHRLTPRHILVKFWSTGDKQKILKASRARKEITYQGSKIRLTADLAPGTIHARSQWSGIIKVLQEEGFHPRLLYPAKLAFEFKGKTKVFFDIEEFMKFISNMPFLKERLDNIL